MREGHDSKAIRGMVTRAETVADGSRPLRRGWFVKDAVVTEGVDWALAKDARQVAGLRGNVTSLPSAARGGAAVVGDYDDLGWVEQSDRRTKSDLRARPVLHHQHDAIDEHLTVVFAVLDGVRERKDVSGTRIRRIVQTLPSARLVTIEINSQRPTLDPTDTTHAVPDRIGRGHSGKWHESGQAIDAVGPP